MAGKSRSFIQKALSNRLFFGLSNLLAAKISVFLVSLPMVRKIPTVIFLVPGFLLACTNLKPVQLLATEANRGLQYFQNLCYSFASHCRDHCYFQKIQANPIDRDLFCHCAVYQEADNVVKDLFLELENYWQGFSSLGSPELASFDLSAAVKGLQSSNLIDVSEAAASSFQKLSEIAVKWEYWSVPEEADRILHEGDRSLPEPNQ